jgi:hypothetical protein
MLAEDNPPFLLHFRFFDHTGYSLSGGHYRADSIRVVASMLLVDWSNENMADYPRKHSGPCSFGAYR